jgi:hypothetical protein
MTSSFLLSAAATASTSAFQALVSGGGHDGDGDGDGDDRSPPKYQDQAGGQRDLYTQIVISSIFGLSAFLTFCVSPVPYPF